MKVFLYIRGMIKKNIYPYVKQNQHTFIKWLQCRGSQDINGSPRGGSGSRYGSFQSQRWKMGWGQYKHHYLSISYRLDTARSVKVLAGLALVQPGIQMWGLLPQLCGSQAGLKSGIWSLAQRSVDLIHFSVTVKDMNELQQHSCSSIFCAWIQNKCTYKSKYSPLLLTEINWAISGRKGEKKCKNTQKADFAH